MKSFFLGFILLVITFTACRSPQKPSDPAPLPETQTQASNAPTASGKVPEFECFKGCQFKENYKQAFRLLQYANTPEFEAYFLKKRKNLAHVDGKSPELVIKTFRAQLESLNKVTISFYSAPWSSAIGAWDIDRIKENSRFNLAPKFLAPHLLHETSHIFGWIHQGNYKMKNDNVNSFPYAVGDEFEAYLLEKGL